MKLRSLAIIAAVCSMAACNIVEDPIPENRVRLSDSKDILDSIETAHGVPAPVRTVLLEDYTGHKCGNCPQAAEEAVSLQNTYGEQVVVMAVHLGFFSKTESNANGKYGYDFTTPAGNDFEAHFKPVSFPIGMLNRKSHTSSSNPLMSVGNWRGAVAAEVAKAPVANLTLTHIYDAGGRKLDIKVRAEALTNLSGDYKVGVYITEDSIVNWQNDYSKSPSDIPNYVHRHVFRTDVNSSWGEAIFTDPAEGMVESKYYQITLDPEWKDRHCSIVAFIYKDGATNREVIQAAEQHIELH